MHTQEKMKKNANPTNLIDTVPIIKHNCLKVDKAKGLTHKDSNHPGRPFFRKQVAFSHNLHSWLGDKQAVKAWFAYAETSEYCSMIVTMKFLPAQVWQREFLSITP
jgi:hypothetical protein